MDTPKGKWRLGEILVQHGWISWQRLEAVLEIQHQSRKEADANLLVEQRFISKKMGQSLCLGEILIKNNWLTWEDLALALETQRQTGNIIGEILIQKGFILKANLYRALAQQFGKPFVDFVAIKIPAEVISLVPKHLVQECRIMPLQKQKGFFLFAIADPQDIQPEMELRRIITDCEIRFAIAPPEEIQKAISHYYGS